MKIGVTGSTGQLGTIVIEKLKGKTGTGNIVALARTPQKAAGLRVEIRAFDYTRAADQAGALQGIDALLLISSNDIGQRAAQHALVIEAAKKSGIKWIVYTSLLRADTSSLSLAGEHLATEEMLKKSGIPYTILRNGWYTENHTGSLQGSVAAGALLGSAGNAKFCSATREDFAEAAAAVLTGNGHQGKTYELAGDTAYTMTELAAEVSKQAGKQIPYINLPEADYAEKLKGFGVPEGFAHAIAGWDVSASRGDLYDDKHQLSALIGRPTTALTVAVKKGLQTS